MPIQIRLVSGVRWMDKSNIEVCPHINLNGRHVEEDDECEYTTPLLIECKVCVRVFQYQVFVN